LSAAGAASGPAGPSHSCSSSDDKTVIQKEDVLGVTRQYFRLSWPQEQKLCCTGTTDLEWLNRNSSQHTSTGVGHSVK
jgi:hypothetical protein